MTRDDSLKVIIAGLIANVVLCLFKTFAGLTAHSHAVFADGIHSISDIATDAGLLVGAHYWHKPADFDHPYGHGRLESLIALGLSVVLVIVGTGIVLSSLSTLDTGPNLLPGWIAAFAALASLISKEVMFRWTFKKAEKLNSSALRANAWHHRSDALSSIPALIAVVGIRFIPEWWFLDAVGAIIVAVLIFRAAWPIGFEAFQDLMDRGASGKVVDEIENTARQVKDVEEVHKIRTRKIGRGWSVDLHVLVPSELTVKRGHEIAEQVHRRLLTNHKYLSDVVVHIEPSDHSEDN